MVDYVKAAESFTYIYEASVWGEGSGASSPSVTGPYMKLLQDFIANNEIKSVVDVGCGDWQFSQFLDLSRVQYHGFDVVESVIQKNRKLFSNTNIKFDVLTSLSELPIADMVVCKDVLQHLPVEEAIDYIKWFATNYKFSLITNDSSAVEKTADGLKSADWVNGPIGHGSWRPLRLDLPPFLLDHAVLLKWEIDSPTMSWTKSTCLLLQSPQIAPKKGLLARFAR